MFYLYYIYFVHVLDFNLEVLMHDLAPEGFVRLAHCPSNAGCRAVIKQNNGNEIFPITENYLFTFKVKYSTILNNFIVYICL